jgi:hypothetical protein
MNDSCEKKSGLDFVETIRPYQVLLIQDTFGEEVKFFMPQPQAWGSLTTIEALMLVKLMRIVNPKKVFEFGTYKGLTTRLLLENLSENDINDKRLYTLDLPALEGVSFQGGDLAVAAQSIGYSRKYLTSPRKKWVNQLLQDSMTLDGDDYKKQFEFIFVDANHEVSYARRDTENSLKMLADSPSCIVWHDYNNPEFPELTQYLDDLSKEIKIYHIGDTMLAFHLRGHEVPPKRVFE